jgi:hypothetical protein
MLRIRNASAFEIERGWNAVLDIPAYAYVGEDDGALRGAGGLAWSQNRCWLWYQVIDTDPAYALPVIRKARALMDLAASLGEEEVYVFRDEAFATSEKLLRILGFRPTGEMLDGHEVHVCRVSKQSG